MEGFTKHYLQQLTVRFYSLFMTPSKRSIDYFGFLIGVHYGSYVVSIIMLRVLCCDYLIHIVQEKIFMIHVIIFIPSDSYNSIFIS